MNTIPKILTTFASTVSIGFGVWHFFVPKIWNWYSYIETSATELVIAVRAINVFFSMCLVLLGIGNLLFIFNKSSNKFSLIVILSMSAILWITRSILQFIYPQGSQNPVILYSMTSVFLVVTLSYLLSLILIIRERKF